MRSGLQKDVLSLYRNLLRAANAQFHCSVRENLKKFIRHQFKSKATQINPKDITAIEHQMRLARRRLEFFEEHKSIKKFTF